MVSAPKIAGPRPCACTDAALAAADLVGIKADYADAPAFAFTTADGSTFDEVATALRYFARLRPDLCLYGRSFADALAVDHWVGRVTERFLTPLVALSEWSRAGGDCDKIFQDLSTRLTAVDEHLKHNTFLACERLTIADLLLAVIVARYQTFSPAICEQFAHIRRWSATVLENPSIRKFVQNQQPGKKAEGKKAGEGKKSGGEAKKTDKSAEKSEDIEEQIAAEEKAKAKKANPLDQLPPSKLELDAWKREYSNSKDLIGVSMPWFWQHFDSEGYSLWFMKYNKLEGENTVGYATSNMLGGFLQRLDNAFRKYSFAVINIVGETGDFDIQGVWLIRGQEVPFELTDHPSFEYYTFRKLDPVADKALVEEYWTADDKVEGRAIDSCKVWK